MMTESITMIENIAYDDVAIMEPIQKKQKTEWEPHGLESRRREKYELKDETPTNSTQENCFGCIYIGERVKVTVPEEKFLELITLIRECVARSDPVTLAKYVHKRYTALQKDVNDNLLDGNEPLPDWSQSMILNHIRNHNTDAEIQTWLRLTEIQELMQVALKASVEIDQETGHIRINTQQNKAYQDLLKLYCQVAKLDLSKMIFMSNGDHINMDNARQEIIAKDDKDLFNYFDPIDKI